MVGLSSAVTGALPSEQYRMRLQRMQGGGAEIGRTPGVGAGAGSPGGFGRAINSIGGYSTIGSLAGLGLGVPGLGMLGGIADTVNDYGYSQQFDPSYSPGFGGVLGGLGAEFTSGLLGQRMIDDAIDNYRNRTGTGLNNAALKAAHNFHNVTGQTYSGPKGVVGPQATGPGGSRGAERSRNRSRHRDTSPGRRGARDRGGFGGGAGERSGDLGPGGRHGEL